MKYEISSAWKDLFDLKNCLANITESNTIKVKAYTSIFIFALHLKIFLPSALATVKVFDYTFKTLKLHSKLHHQPPNHSSNLKR